VELPFFGFQELKEEGLNAKHFRAENFDAAIFRW